uniref:Nuclear receptor NHR-114 n=1 Tax=Caenorhabditis elegans TaxID=6239 RepID=Q86PI6_CAEEL|nr:nuclear receptor NHR-114 [Caenorhabditis elegans]
MTPQSSPSSSRDHVCLVCQDFASGYHYGVPSCVGCKTFFRRTIMKKQKYICQFEGNCPVDKTIRCACRYCRFEKCLSVGMDRNALQQNRDPIGYTKRTRRPKKELKTTSDCSSDEGASTPPSVSPLQLSPPPISPLLFQAAPLKPRRCILQTLAEREKCANDLRLSEYLPIRSLHEALCSKALLNDTAFLEKWGQPSERHQIFDLRFVNHDDYHYWHERDWFLLTEYAKTFDVFEALDYQDKAELVRHAAITVPVLVQVWNSPDYGPDTIVFPDGAYFDRTPEPTRPAGLNRKKYQMLDLVLKPFRDLQLDATEFAAFKAVTFLNPGPGGISIRAKLSL